MNQGKVSETILKRSVFKNIHSKNTDVMTGSGIANDSAIIKNNGYISVTTTGIVDYAKIDREYYTFYKVFNNILASGATPKAIELSIMLPEDCEEKQLKDIVKAFDEECKKYDIQICGGHTQVTKCVREPIVSVTMIGEQFLSNKEQQDFIHNKEVESGCQIVMTKAIGIEGTAIISHEKEEILRKRFSGRFTEQCLEFKNHISIFNEAQTAVSNGAIAMHDVSGGGIFGALWEIAEKFNKGIEVELKKIPVWQETIEVTELFDINPYTITSLGAMLIIVEDGEKLVEKLEEAGIPASVIGIITDGHDKVIINEDEKRFLEPPRGDEIYKMK